MARMKSSSRLACHGSPPHPPDMIRLAQNQLWKKGERYYRIVIWERLAIRYKEMERPDAMEGSVHDISKKEFCRLIKGAELVDERQASS